MLTHRANDLPSFLECLLPTSSAIPWGGTQQTWLFRGHGNGNADWKLVPTLFRRSSYLSINTQLAEADGEYLPAPSDGALMEMAGGRGIASGEDVIVLTDPMAKIYMEVLHVERRIVVTLRGILEDRGSVLPELDAIGVHLDELRRGIAELKSERDGYATAPTADRLPDTLVHAFARHVGLPTRLLDLTRSPWIAAYFAARSWLEESKRPDDFAVFALSTNYVQNSAWHRDRAVVVVPARVENTRLNAQQGMFLKLDIPVRAPDGSSWDLVAGHREVPASTVQNMAEMDNQVVKLTASGRIAEPLLRVLRTWGIHGAAMFPGEQGLSAFVREQLLDP